MAADYLHKHPQFPDLIRIVAEEKGIAPALVEKDYWIMHCLYGLQHLGLTFELKGGTSLSKGFPDHQPVFGGHRYPHRAPEGPGREDRTQSRQARAYPKPPGILRLAREN